MNSNGEWVPQFWVCGSPVSISELILQCDLDRAEAVAIVDYTIMRMLNGLL